MKFIKEMIVKKGQATGAAQHGGAEDHTAHDAPIGALMRRGEQDDLAGIDLTPPPGRRPLSGAPKKLGSTPPVLKLTEKQMAPEGVPSAETPVQPVEQSHKEMAAAALRAAAEKTARQKPAVSAPDDDFDDEEYDDDPLLDQDFLDAIDADMDDDEGADPFAGAPKRRETSSPREIAKQRVLSRAKSRQLSETSKKPWDIDDEDDDYADDYAEDDFDDTPAAVAPPVAVPTPSAGRSGRQAGRVKTRLLGFHHSDGAAGDMFDQTKAAEPQSHTQFPVGWIVVVNGPGRGACFTLFDGVSQIGRGDDQAITLDFGDTTISRSNHAAVAYDTEQHKFFLGHGGKSNLVRLNNRPLLSTEELGTADLIRLGETTLRFIPLCDDEFNWESKDQGDTDNASSV